MTHHCRVCNNKLQKDNKFKGNPKKGRGYICKKCHNDQKTDRRHSAPKNKCITLKRDKKYPNFKFGLLSKDERLIYQFQDNNDFISFKIIRKIQKRFGRCHDSLSSREKCRVETLLEEEIKDDDGEIIKIKRWYEASKCSECGSEVNYNKHNEQQCSNCGLIQGVVNFIDDSINTNKKNRSDYNYRFESDDKPTFDVYYSRAYNKGRSSSKIILKDEDNNDCG